MRTVSGKSGLGRGRKQFCGRDVFPAGNRNRSGGNGTGNILIAYFSWSGNTEAVAGMIQEEMGGDLFEIAPAEPYTEDCDTLLEIAQTEQQEEARPELAA